MLLERAIIITFIGWALTFLALTFTFSPGTSANDIGPAIFPQMMTVALIAICIYYGVVKLRKKNKNIAQTKFVSYVFYVIILVFIYLMSMGWINYYLSTPIFMVLLGKLLGENNYKTLAVLAVGFTLFAYLVFFRLLGIQLNM